MPAARRNHRQVCLDEASPVQDAHRLVGFVGEIAIVIIGVLIALWAQQVVENRSDLIRADNALAALREEVAQSHFAASETQIVRPCVDVQLDAIEKRLVAGDRTPLPLYSDDAKTPFVGASVAERSMRG